MAVIINLDNKNGERSSLEKILLTILVIAFTAGIITVGAKALIYFNKEVIPIKVKVTGKWIDNKYSTPFVITTEPSLGASPTIVTQETYNRAVVGKYLIFKTSRADSNAFIGIACVGIVISILILIGCATGLIQAIYEN